VAENLAHVVIETKYVGGNLKLLDGDIEQVRPFADPNCASLRDDLGLMLLEDHRLLH
jgi:hypothetical protein